MLPAMVEAKRNQRNTSPAQASASRERRKLARSNFLEFCKYVDPQFETPKHIRFVASKLQEVALYIASRGTKGIGRLMILMPPRHGKSELASRNFPAWLLGLAPDSRVLLTSYGADLAVKNNRSLRDLVMSQRYQALFGNLSVMKDRAVELSSDSRSAQAWDLAQPHKGGVVATGVGGGITGLGADLLVLDDPFKNREEAESETRRDLVDDWYRSSAHTRLSPHGAIVLFHTRWHPDDLAGRLIRRMAEEPNADQWTIVYLPAVTEPGVFALDEDDQKMRMLDGVYLALADQLGRKDGEALWGERFPLEWLEDKKANLGGYEYSALYLQNPYLRSGNWFKREYFNIVDSLPKPEDVTMRIRYWDKAGTRTGKGGDYAVGVRMSITKSRMVYVEHVMRMQCTPMQREEQIVKTARADAELAGPKVVIFHQQDPGSAGLDSAQATNRRLAVEGFKSSFETVTGDKEVRAGPWQTGCQGGMAYLVQAGWNKAFIDEHIAFPRGSYDDQVDVASGAFVMLTSKIKRESKIL